MICVSFKSIGCINEVNSDFSVSGMDSGVLLQGRPFGGCSILYCNSLSPFITPLKSFSNRFCGLKFSDSLGVSVCVYIPY